MPDRPQLHPETISEAPWPAPRICAWQDWSAMEPRQHYTDLVVKSCGSGLHEMTRGAEFHALSSVPMHGTLHLAAQAGVLITLC